MRRRREAHGRDGTAHRVAADAAGGRAARTYKCAARAERESAVGCHVACETPLLCRARMPCWANIVNRRAPVRHVARDDENKLFSQAVRGYGYLVTTVVFTAFVRAGPFFDAITRS